MHNLRLPLSEPRTFKKEAECLFDIRTWAPFMPAATIRLDTREPHVLVTVAYYHALMIAAAPYLPAVSKALFLRKKTQVIGNFWTDLGSRQEQRACDGSGAGSTVALSNGWSLNDPIEMTVIPLICALRYRVQRAAADVESEL